MTDRPVYEWSAGGRMPPGANAKSAQVIGERLHDLATSPGGLTPERVVADARSVDSPFHVHLEWDDTIAAEEYRKEQARSLIRSVRTVVADVGPVSEDRKPVRAFINVTTEDAGSQYMPIARVLATVTLRDQMLASAYRELAAFQQKYGHLAELAAVFEAAAIARK